MMKKQLLKGVAVLLTLAFLVVPALAKMSVAPNEKGDLLLYPVYYAVEGLQTTFTVINTSSTECAVAKVVLRSHKYSIEVLDFLIYLTPNDVFKATIKYEGGKYILTTTDDSILLGDLVHGGITGQASVAHPLTFELAAPTVNCADATDDSSEHGYIEVIEASAFSPNAECAVLADGTIAKEDLFNRYWTATIADFQTANILTGVAELVFPGAEYSIYKPTVIKNYEQNALLTVGVETILGAGNVGGDLCTLEGVLSKNNLVVPYFNSTDAATIAFLTFTTKLMRCPDGDLGAARGPYFWQFDDVDYMYQPSYGVDMYDLEEHTIHSAGCPVSPCPVGTTSRLPEEVNIIGDWLGTANPFSEGWARVRIDGNTSCEVDEISFTGAPAIGLVAEITQEGLALTPPAYDFGAVSCGDASQVDGAYQLGFSDCD